MKKRKQQWLQTYTRNAQTSDNNIQHDNTWSTYTPYTESHRPHQIQTNFQNHYYGVPYTNKYNECENDCSEIKKLSNDDSNAQSKPTPIQDKTVVKKEGLYKDADSFYDNDFSRDNASSSTASANTGTWTEAFWHKEDDNKSQSSGHSLGKFKTRNRQNKLERSLNKMLAQPVEMSKGKSLLEKMGWQGGGLGKDGDGIVEPIAPKATYAVKTMGLGHVNERTNVVKKKIAKPAKNKINKAQCKGNFCTNVLLNILEFVRNDRTIEMLFDSHLFNGERKRIHKIVEQIRELDNLDDFKGLKDRDLDIVKDIWVHNVYQLWTQSDGERKNRQLCLYKEAPAHVYLVTPDDLRDDDEEIANDIEEKEDNEFANDSNETNEKTDDIQKETVITNDVDVVDIKTDKNIKLDKDIAKESPVENANNNKCKDANKEEHKVETEEVIESIISKIVGYFKKFADDATYTEFRCLGPFNDEEVNNLKLLFDICMRKDDSESQEKIEVVKVLDNSAFVFDVYEDINGSMVISKIERDQLPAQ